MELVDDDGVPVAEAMRVGRRHSQCSLGVVMAGRKAGMVALGLTWVAPVVTARPPR